MKNGFFETVWGDKFGRVLSLGLCVLFVWSAIAPYGKVTVAGVSHDMDSLKDAWNAAHPEAQQIQYMGMGER